MKTNDVKENRMKDVKDIIDTIKGLSEGGNKESNSDSVIGIILDKYKETNSFDNMNELYTEFENKRVLFGMFGHVLGRMNAKYTGIHKISDDSFKIGLVFENEDISITVDKYGIITVKEYFDLMNNHSGEKFMCLNDFYNYLSDRYLYDVIPKIREEMTESIRTVINYDISISTPVDSVRYYHESERVFRDRILDGIYTSFDISFLMNKYNNIKYILESLVLFQDSPKHKEDILVLSGEGDEIIYYPSSRRWIVGIPVRLEIIKEENEFTVKVTPTEGTLDGVINIANDIINSDGNSVVRELLIAKNYLESIIKRCNEIVISEFITKEEII